MEHKDFDNDALEEERARLEREHREMAVEAIQIALNQDVLRDKNPSFEKIKTQSDVLVKEIDMKIVELNAYVGNVSRWTSRLSGIQKLIAGYIKHYNKDVEKQGEVENATWNFKYHMKSVLQHLHILLYDLEAEIDKQIARYLERQLELGEMLH